MKYMKYDNTNSQLNIYANDTHDTIPTGCIAVSDEVWEKYIDNQGSYVWDETKASEVEDGTEVDNIDNLFSAYIMPLSINQANKILELSNSCNQIIINGFYSEADGKNKLYDFELENQVNISVYKSNILIAQLSGQTVSAISYYGKGEDCHDYTAAQFLQLAQDAEEFKTETIKKYKNLKAYVEALTTIDEVEAVTWDTEIPSTTTS